MLIKNVRAILYVTDCTEHSIVQAAMTKTAVNNDTPTHVVARNCADEMWGFRLEIMSVAPHVASVFVKEVTRRYAAEHSASPRIIALYPFAIIQPGAEINSAS